MGVKITCSTFCIISEHDLILSLNVQVFIFFGDVSLSIPDVQVLPKEISRTTILIIMIINLFSRTFAFLLLFVICPTSYGTIQNTLSLLFTGDSCKLCNSFFLNNSFSSKAFQQWKTNHGWSVSNFILCWWCFDSFG